MEEARAHNLSLRARGTAKAMSLAEEQHEERDLRLALKLVAKYDLMVQRAENEKQVRSILAWFGVEGQRQKAVEEASAHASKQFKAPEQQQESEGTC